MARLTSPLFALAALAVALPASGDAVRVHAQGAGARAVGGWQEKETGWGASGAGAVELGLGRVSPQVAVSAVGLSSGAAPEPGFAAHEGTSALVVLGGVRARPLGAPRRGRMLTPRGVWLDAGAGGASTGGQVRAALGADVGYDVIVGKVAAGPYGGYLHVLQPDGQLRADDARIVLAGMHVEWGAVEEVRVAVPVDGDRDADRIRDSVDRCPDVPEDHDGFEDEDGCPDRDDDGDGVLDLDDACPRVPGIATMDPKTSGCPDDDRDRDGIRNEVDRCPDEPEDKDGHDDDDGCPDPDNDGDGIPDVTNRCPDEPETFNGYADDDGCPDEDQVRVVGDRIVLDDRVHFATDSAVVLGVSYPLLRRVAKLLVDHPEYIHADVYGYADERGADWYNQELSELRAKTVRQLLVEFGVAKGRLTAVGWGERNPLVDGHGADAWRENRRVELILTRATRGGRP